VNENGPETTAATESGGAPPLDAWLGFQLSTMMFLQYAIWGAWLPILFPFLQGHRGFTPEQIGDMFAVGAVGAIIAPFVAGQIADRWFNTERFLGLSHILGAVLVWQLGGLESYGSFLTFSLLYSLIYSPTLSLTNSLAFHHLPDRDRDFGRIRLWGTIGWIVVGIGVGQWLYHAHSPADLSGSALKAAQDAGRADAFRLSAILGVILGIFCFLLPRTPPQKSQEKSATLAALREIRANPLLTLFLVAVPVSCVHQFYFVHASEFLSSFQRNLSGVSTTINRLFGAGGGGVMTIGQISEIAVLAILPFVAKKVSRKSLLAVGLSAYAVRMFLFGFVDAIPLPTVVTLLLGVSLHGLCFGCFMFVAFLIVDEECTNDVKASAQSLFNLVVVGIGIIVGSKVALWVHQLASTGDQLNYRTLFSYPMWASLACLVAVLSFYPGNRRNPSQHGETRGA